VNTISARRPDPEIFVGKKAHESVISVLKNVQNGSGVGQTVDNKPVHIFYHRLRKAPWSVILGVQRLDIENNLQKAVLPVAVSGIFLLVITVLIAWLSGRRITVQLGEIARAATAFRGGQNTIASLHPIRIRELIELKTTLECAMEERTRYETKLKSLLADKDLLMQEIHHRVKNSLQLVRGILSLQARNSEHQEAKVALQAAATRILTVADVHQHLYQGHSTADVNVEQYLNDLGKDLTKSLLEAHPEAKEGVASEPRHVEIIASDIVWPTEKVMALGLLVTELATNSIKYGAGVIKVNFSVEEDGSAIVCVEDEGSGFPDDFELADDTNLSRGSSNGYKTGLGRKLINSLVRPEEGSIVIDRSVTFGRVIITLNATWRNHTPE
jgi:two-component sensor histidine kinase